MQAISTSLPLTFDYTCAKPQSVDPCKALLEAFARSRGCATDEEVTNFLSLNPVFRNPLLGLPDFQKAIDRVLQAMHRNEAITVFGDYDCDGVTSVAQFVNFFRAGQYTNYRVYIPDRFVEDYGLTAAAVDQCLAEQKPTLIVAVDCGSTAIPALENLRAKGVDVIVLDHHAVTVTDGHPSFAHLNPKASASLATSSVLQDAARLSAAGLSYFFVDELTDQSAIACDKQTNLILAGIGTYVDVMPLVGTNRSLVKQAIRLLNSPAAYRVPGILAILQGAGWGQRPVTEYTLGFVIGPCLNATGRLSHAKASVSLLCSVSNTKAVERAKVLVDSNNERKAIQEGMCKEALALAESIVKAKPETKVIVVSAAHWHAGIVGIVAGKIREAHGRPAIVIARLESGFWKGSGRSTAGFDLGSIASGAAAHGIIEGGGGHAMACGVKLTDEQLPTFSTYVEEASKGMAIEENLKIQVIGDANWLSADGWDRFNKIAGPFGQGNPKPLINVGTQRIQQKATQVKRTDGSVWGVKAALKVPSFGPMTVTWDQVEKARATFQAGAAVSIIAEFSRSTAADGRVFDNWKVTHAK